MRLLLEKTSEINDFSRLLFRQCAHNFGEFLSNCSHRRTLDFKPKISKRGIDFSESQRQRRVPVFPDRFIAQATQQFSHLLR